ncbi:MAG: ParB/RepB/Spo0J family partition protein [Candidatus Omnitrophica bacterium]|nr:ParB/RepB/Spo0J family partition protein [Candidatus Omnitrophota bacterium]MDD5430094.1 ParB/RepB/Spo0J family partition protein [Candidatus Omnitrophota bacterium]
MTIQRKVLGKGLDALIPKKTTAILPKEFVYMSLQDVCPAKNQPRQSIDTKELEELAASIKEKGFLQPIIVRKINAQQYEVVAGERRYQAAKSLELKEIPTIIKDVNEKDAFILAIIENLQRKDLNPIEEGQAFKRLMEELNFSLEEIGQFVGKDKTTVVNSLRLLKLPDIIQNALRQGRLTRTQARTIAGVVTPQAQEKLFHQILNGAMTVRDIEKSARSLRARKKPADPFVLEAEEKLQKALGTKVKLFNKKNNKGRIVIEYYTLKDLERITRRIG